MRLHRLEIEGFGPFLERQVVDFDRFADDGIFLIAGRTGAGKSSILDAVCFALYGAVPRYEGGDKRLRSDHCAPDDISEVVVEFSTAAGRYRVSRSPEYQRPAKRGGGLTTQAPTAALEEQVDGTWIGVAARAREVGAELDAILQLSREQFLQVILLAQNRFARFLLADSKERQALLRRLFATERFEDVQARFDDRRRASENALQASLAAVNAALEQAERLVTAAELWGEHVPDGEHPDTTEGRLAALRAALERAQYQAERRAAESGDAEKRLSGADAALATARDERKGQQQRDETRQALERLDAEEATIAEARHVLQQARTAEALRATLDAADRAATAHAKAASAEHIARETWLATGVDIDEPQPDLDAPAPSAPALEQWAEQRTARSGEWRRAAELEKTAPARAAERARAEAEVIAASALIDARDAERSELPARIERVTARRDEERRSADRVDDLQQTLTVATARRDAAVHAERMRAVLVGAERTLADASAALAATQTALADVRRRRLEGFAGEIAATLADGQPCSVCGATEHPSPAEHSDPVSQDDVDHCEAARDDAAAAERDALESVSGVKSELAALDAVAGARTATEAERDVAAATEAHSAAQSAVRALADAERELAEVTQRAALLDKAREEAVEAGAAAHSALALIIQRSEDAQTMIVEARGSCDSVADRLAEAAVHISAARAFAAALDETARRARAAADAVAEQQQALSASDFDDPTAARAALRSAAEQLALDERVTAHAVQREKHREALLELELRALPEEPIELGGFEAAAQSARAEWKEAVDVAGRARTTAEQLGGLIDSAAVEHAASAAQQNDFDVLKALADAIAGRAGNTHKMTLETFVLAAELEEIVEAANRRLTDMSTGRYQLQHSDALAVRGAASGLGIVVFDAFTGQTRPAQSLSGGETFLSSLALALGLAEVVTARAGGIQLDTLFIDEGFGSLDADTLDIAMRTLDELRSGGRTVGIISHVESMQEQIPAQLVVEQTDRGPSRIRA